MASAAAIHLLGLPIEHDELITESMVLYELTSTVIALTNLAKSSYRDLALAYFRCYGALPLSLQLKFYTKNRVDSDILMQCYDTAYRNVIHLINGQIRMSYLPNADPADGNSRLWKKTVAGEDFLMVGT